MKEKSILLRDAAALIRDHGHDPAVVRRMTRSEGIIAHADAIKSKSKPAPAPKPERITPPPVAPRRPTPTPPTGVPAAAATLVRSSDHRQLVIAGGDRNEAARLAENEARPHGQLDPDLRRAVRAGLDAATAWECQLERDNQRGE